MSKTNLNEKYIELAKAWGKAINDGNDKVANKIYKKQMELLQLFENNLSDSIDFLQSFIGNSCIALEYCAIIHLKRLGLTIIDFEERLYRIKNDPEAKLIGVMAYIDIKEYQKEKQQKLYNDLMNDIQT